MGKIIKRTLKVLLVLVLLVVVLAVILMFSFNPNRLKPYIINRVYQMTGYELVMDGDLTWAFFPSLGITSGHLGLKNPPGSKKLYLVEADRFRFSVHLLPLLQGRVEAGTLAAMNASGDWTDPTTHQRVMVSHLNGWAEGISLTEPFPLKLTFEFLTRNPDLGGQVMVTGNASINLHQKAYDLRALSLKAGINTGNTKISLQLSGNLLFDEKAGQIHWQGLNGKILNIPVEGDLQIVAKGGATTGVLNLKPFDLKTCLAQAGLPVSSWLQSAEDAEGVVNLDGSTGETVVNGNFRIPSAVAEKLSLKDVSIPFRFQKSTLDIEAARAAMYEGSVLMKAIARLQTTPWQYAVQLGFSGIQMAPLLHDFDSSARISLSGVGNVGLMLSFSGGSSMEVLNHLNGTGQFSVMDGQLQGLDIGYLLDSAMALTGKKLSPTLQGNTPFTSLKGTLLISNGIVSNNDLMMDSSRFTVSGKGTINLSASRIDYALAGQIRKSSPYESDSVANLYGLPVPMLVSGPLENPKVRLDSKTLMAELAKQQIKRAAGNLVPSTLPAEVPPKAGQILNQLLGQ